MAEKIFIADKAGQDAIKTVVDATKTKVDNIHELIMLEEGSEIISGSFTMPASQSNLTEIFRINGKGRLLALYLLKSGSSNIRLQLEVDGEIYVFMNNAGQYPFGVCDDDMLISRASGGYDIRFTNTVVAVTRLKDTKLPNRPINTGSTENGPQFYATNPPIYFNQSISVKSLNPSATAFTGDVVYLIS